MHSLRQGSLPISFPGSSVLLRGFFPGYSFFNKQHALSLKTSETSANDNTQSGENQNRVGCEIRRIYDPIRIDVLQFQTFAAGPYPIRDMPVMYQFQEKT